MKHFITALVLASFLGCAHGKMGTISKELDLNSFDKSKAITVNVITADGIEFSGDKANDETVKLSESKTIEAVYNIRIADELRKKGFQAKVSTGKPANSGIVLNGKVTKFEHGSGAARFWVGMGAGSSNLYTTFTLTDLDHHEDLAIFEVIGTSGGSGGWTAMGSFMNAHLIDGGKKVAQYLSGKK